MAGHTARKDHPDLKRMRGLMDAAKAQGLRVRLESGAFKSGFCVHQNEEMLFLNRRLDPLQRCLTLGRLLAPRLDLQAVENEDLREFLQDFAHAPAPEGPATEEGTA